MTSGPSPTEFLTPYQLYANSMEQLLLYGRPESGFACGLAPWHVSDRLWQKHGVLAALRQHLTHYLHLAVFRDHWTVPPHPDGSPTHPTSTSTLDVSEIWFNESERRRTDDGSFDHYWRCGHCEYLKILKAPKIVMKRTNDSSGPPHGTVQLRHFFKTILMMVTLGAQDGCTSFTRSR
jgi:hypothetical protein